MKFIVAGREEIEQGFVVRTEYVVISIADPGKRRPRIRKPCGFRDVLFLQFHDAMPDDGVEPTEEIVLMTTDHAAAIWEFVNRYRDTVGTIVVHCEQGMSRSPAVAAAISTVLGEPEKRFFREYAPNQYVYELMIATAPTGGSKTDMPPGDKDALRHHELPQKQGKSLKKPPRKKSVSPDTYLSVDQRGVEEAKLFAAIIRKLPRLEEVLRTVNCQHAYEDAVYRFYHGSFKVFGIQASTQLIVKTLQSLAPRRPLCSSFSRIVAEGTGKEWTEEVNQRWPETTRPMLEAFFHARYFLEMVCKFGKELKEPPQPMPSGWAAVLELHRLR
jgi:predicted protein tyrosine phosphatase